MRLIAYDFEALVRMAQQAPWRDGLSEARAWAEDLRRTKRPEGGFGKGRGPARAFDIAELDRVMERLERAGEKLGGDRPLRELIGDFPAKTLFRAPEVDGWAIYEDLVRLWTQLVSEPWNDAQLLAADGARSLLGPLGRATKRDLRLAPYSPACAGIGKPYPQPWRDKPRARIYHVTTDYLDWLAEIGNDEIRETAKISHRQPQEIAADVGALIRHFELARQLDTVVAVDPDDAFWG